MKRALIILLLLLAACGSAAPPEAATPLRVQYTSASGPWIAALYTCAGKNTVLSESRPANYLDPLVDMTIRIGQPVALNSPAFQIGSEEILVVVNRVTPITALTAEQVQGLFSGRIGDWSQIDPVKTGKVQVWAFPGDDDSEQVFEGAVLKGAPITSRARLASSPDEMSQAVTGDENAIGILPHHWKASNVATVFTAASVPVLAITPSEPAGALRQILTCLTH